MKTKTSSSRQQPGANSQDQDENFYQEVVDQFGYDYVFTH